jgi:hypothetical protein
MVIGGQGVVVEVDKSKFEKRKYHRGHHVEGAWVIGGVKRTNERLMFAEVVDRRNTQTLIDVILRHVVEGSIVHTDMWREYAQLEDLLNIQHRTVNHSQHFVNPEDGTYTNSIEGTWNGIKLKSLQGTELGKIWKDTCWNSFGEENIQQIYGIILLIS